MAMITSPENMSRLDEIMKESWRIAHPRGIRREEFDEIVSGGKVVIAMSMSIHATEVGGTQMAPELAYELATNPSTLRFVATSSSSSFHASTLTAR